LGQPIYQEYQGGCPKIALRPKAFFLHNGLDVRFDVLPSGNVGLEALGLFLFDLSGSFSENINSFWVKRFPYDAQPVLWISYPWHLKFPCAKTGAVG
jgi:hypothetical protein